MRQIKSFLRTPVNRKNQGGAEVEKVGGLPDQVRGMIAV